ncbi:MAG: CHASE3 domain-containing protein, partial [Cystobacter sp.]
MSIGKKIALGFGLSLVVLLGVSMVAFLGAQQLQSTTKGLVESRERRRFMFTSLSLLVDAETSQRGFIITGDRTYLDPYWAARRVLGENLVELRHRLIDFPDQLASLNRIEPIIRERLATMERTRLVREQSNGPDAVELAVRASAGRGKILMDQVRAGLGEMVAAEDVRWAAYEADARESAWLSMLALGMGSVLGFLIVGVGSWLLTRSIIGPIEKLVMGTVQLGMGNLDHRIDVHNDDETGELARAFNDMVDRRKLAEAQLAEQARQREHTLRTVAEFVSQLAGSSSEILVSTTQQVAGAQEQGSAVSQTVSTLEEIAQTSEEAAGRARSVSESARQSEEMGRSGRRAVEEAVTAMGAVRGQVESIASRILALAEQAQA